jgi:uncharacterized protein (TIGR00255 family)
MTQSMTGFARVEEKLPWCTLSCEIRSVNQRFLDPTFRLPDSLREHEPRLRELLRKKIHRGKTDCTIKVTQTQDDGSVLSIDQELVTSLVQATEKIAEITGTQNTLQPLDLLKWPGMLKQEEGDPEVLATTTLRVFKATVEQLIDARMREGIELKKFIHQRLDDIAGVVIQVRTQMPAILAASKHRLLERLEELKVELDPSRLEQELVYIAQKADVDEELDRLETHLAEVRRVLETKGAIGRRLDFLMQELNREANTLSSKAIAADSSLQSVELKVLIEQMREQIQNIE